MTIYITRHSETVQNKIGITQGHKDSPLTEKGKLSANKKGLKLKNKNIEIIYSSDLGRCMQTAKIINKYLNAKIILKKDLRERNFGIFNGKKHIEVKKKLNLNNLNLIPPKGESFNQMKRRAINFIKNLKNTKNKRILIITHEGVTRALFSKHISDSIIKIYKDKIY